MPDRSPASRLGRSPAVLAELGAADAEAAIAETRTGARRGSSKAAKPSRSAASGRLSAEERRAARRLEAEIRRLETDDRFTPPELVDAVEESFGEIDFDPCWHSASAVRPKRYLDVRQGHNGLRDPWSGGVAFVNPPWSSQDKWVRRAYDEWMSGRVDTVVCLVPAATGALVFHRTLSKVADVFFLEGRPRFFKTDGSSEPTMVNVMIVVFGGTYAQKRRFAELVRARWLPPEVPPTSADVSPFSCVASAPHGDQMQIAVCGPLAAGP